MSRIERRILAVAGLLAAVTLAPAVAEPPGGVRLQVAATGFEDGAGHALLALCDSRAQYEGDDAYRLARAKPAGGKASFALEDVPPGTYAIKLFHDRNDDQELNIGWMGPEEAYGFSNGARGTFGPPDWDEVAFEVRGDEQGVRIEVE